MDDDTSDAAWYNQQQSEMRRMEESRELTHAFRAETKANELRLREFYRSFPKWLEKKDDK